MTSTSAITAFRSETTEPSSQRHPEPGMSECLYPTAELHIRLLLEQVRHDRPHAAARTGKNNSRHIKYQTAKSK